MKNVARAFLCTAFMALFATTVFANDYVKFKGWKQAETTHFRFIYEDASEQAAQAYAKIADEAWEKIARIYAMPQEKTNVYVFSRLNIVNAYTMFSPPEIIMFDSPLLDSYFGFRDDWMKLFFTHELIHIANITFEDKKYLASKLFGEAFRGMDYSMIPGWALEGLTTVLETELTNGGRGRSPYFELSFKAATLDNNFIPYRLIGTEQEPPYSQIYVMGYIIMRSIADRWGIQALADIERNRTFDRSWEDSVKLVTGQTPQDIYREAKIALEKKYADERKIPEGKIISPNDLNVNYYKPAIIQDDGSIVALREDLSTTAVVLLNPGAKDGMKFYEDEGDLKETILFRGGVELTADEALNIYYTTALNRYDRAPYNETQFPLYKWSKDENGVVSNEPLTHDENSYYQPAVSRNGKVLVAVDQKGLKMRIVRVDTATGEITPVFEDEQYSFIQPALNEDGSKIAFVVLKEDRACIALGDPSTGQYKIVNNTEFDFITDPSNPNFNKDGTLTFCSNDRGRLEIYEAVPNSDEQTFTCTPQLSDPIGALWAYKNDMGIFYTSQSSTGNVIKIKPVEEWGNIADFEGPSPAGEIMTFGPLTNDYEDFNPYAVENQAKEDDKDPVKHRSPEKLAQLEELDPPVTELTDVKRLRPFVSPLLYMPFINVLESGSENHVGIGGFFAGSFPRQQMKQGFIFFDAFYYPGINNFSGDFAIETPLFAGTLDFLLTRNSSLFELNAPKDKFRMQNSAFLGYTLPFYKREMYTSSRSLDFVAFAGGSLTQTADKAFSLAEKLPYEKALSFQAGLDYKQGAYIIKDDQLGFDITNLAVFTFDFSKNKLFAGYEGEFSAAFGDNSFKQEAGIVLRYTDFPSAITPDMSRAHFNGSKEDCLFPGKILVNYTLSMPGLLAGMADINFVVQGLASFGKNTADGGTPDTGKPLNFRIEQKLGVGAELSFPLGITQKIAVGYSGLYDFSKEHPGSDWKVYVSCKMDWLRF